MDGVTPSALYRYFAEREYAERFLAGELLFRPLSFYLYIEDAQVRGDINEGRMTFSPKPGLILTKSDGTRVDGFTHFNGVVDEDEIFVHCLSDTHSDLKVDKFGRHRVEVTDTATFLRRIEAALPPRAAPLFSRKVTYDDPQEPPGARWACPDLTVASKWPAFAWQDEHRLFFTFTDALSFENCTYTVSNGLPARPQRMTPMPAPIAINIEIGIGDICSFIPQ
jgi:hypothetical protein